jgi:ParB family chromosome partitioning protein
MRKSVLGDLDFKRTTSVESHPPLSKIVPDPDQPRRVIDESSEEMLLLADSIIQHGILQPITVSPSDNGTYKIIAGERRWRAAVMASQRGEECARKGYDLNRIPVNIVVPETDAVRFEMQVLENIARSDMTQSDVGHALQKVLEADPSISKTQLGKRLGKSAAWIRMMLAKADPEGIAIAEKLGLSLDVIGGSEMMRMVSWAKDSEKVCVIDAIAQRVSAGEPFSRVMCDEEDYKFNHPETVPSSDKSGDISAEDGGNSSDKSGDISAEDGGNTSDKSGDISAEDGGNTGGKARERELRRSNEDAGFLAITITIPADIVAYIAETNDVCDVSEKLILSLLSKA